MTYSKTLKSLLLAAAILAPATTLAVMGWRAYRAEALLLRERYKRDRVAIARMMANRLGEAARKALEDLQARISVHEPDATLESRFRDAHPLAQHIFLLRGGRLVYPTGGTAGQQRARQSGFDYLAPALDVNTYVRRVREARRLATLVSRGHRAELAGRLGKARRFYRWASRGKAEPAARALLGLSRVERRAGGDARRHLRTLRRRFGGRRDSEGVSYALLADAALAEVGAPKALELLLKMHDRLLKGEYLTEEPVRHHYLRWVLNQLKRTRGVGQRRLSELRRITIDLFASDRFGSLLHRQGVLELQQLATGSIGGVPLDRRTTVVMRRQGEVVVGYTVDEGYLARQVAQHQVEGTSPVRGIKLSLRRVGEVPRRRSGQRLLYTSVLHQPLNHWTIATYLPESDPMELLERRGGLRRLGLVVGLILALSVGLVLTYRGVRRESELARLKSDFASNVSHELKTPLTSIRMYAEMLDHGIASTAEDRRRYQRVIIRESERLGRLIANVLDFSRVERGTRRYELRAEDPVNLTTEAVETFRRLAEGEEISIEMSAGEASLPEVTADREAAVQSILNLLSNAAKYSPEQPQIEVALHARDGEVGVEVRDHGIGIPLSEHKRIFDDFYRAPHSRRIGVEGTGLGLALVRRHMKACGGRVELDSQQGKGSCFTLWFPKAQRSKPESEHV
jgi:two-component system phosphate regulon sensor histidine kinase PhoR